MPAAGPSSTPLSCLFGLNKPTGTVSMTLLNRLQPLFSSSPLFFDPAAARDSGGYRGGRGRGRGKGKGRGGERVKMGQGGTLDPLADGVLVIGTNGATKHLSKFLECTKEYRVIGLLGSATDSYDSEGKRTKTAPWAHVTRESVEEALKPLRGEIEQLPPIFSALKMDGKPLHEYARAGLPLPRPIERRKVTVHSLELLAFTPGGQHSYEAPKEELPEKEKEELARLERMAVEGSTVPVAAAEEPSKADREAEADSVATAAAPGGRPPTFEISMTVSSGTYVRSIIHDIGVALGSAAHVVKLTRTRQGEFALEPAAGDGETFSGGCVAWTLLEGAIKELENAKAAGRVDDPGRELREWEREILRKCKEV